MWTYETKSTRKFVRIGGKWFDPQSVAAVEDVSFAGVLAVRVYLVGGSEITIERSSTTGTPTYDLDASKFINLLVGNH